MNLMRDGWIEKLNYFPSHERWDTTAFQERITERGFLGIPF